MILVGDIHGEVKSYVKLLERYKGEPSVQLGDFGFGFSGDKTLPELPEGSWFIRGNHDNPEVARQSKHYLGDYGFREIDGHRVFFLSGAFSVDQRWRVEGVTWWRDEEMSLPELEEAIERYAQCKPDIMLSHDGPSVALNAIMSKTTVHKDRYPSRTGQALDAMLAAHQPKQWFFGHWHVRFREEINGTEFRCLPELGWCQIHGDFSKRGKNVSSAVVS
jgi:hypothetical protein